MVCRYVQKKCVQYYICQKWGYIADESEKWWVLGDTRVITYFQTYYNAVKNRAGRWQKLE
jgi:hypothetical protein